MSGKSHPAAFARAMSGTNSWRNFFDASSDLPACSPPVISIDWAVQGKIAACAIVNVQPTAASKYCVRGESPNYASSPCFNISWTCSNAVNSDFPRPPSISLVAFAVKVSSFFSNARACSS